MQDISKSASTSSLDWNKGNFPVRKKRSIMPADHMSMAVKHEGVSVDGFRRLHDGPPECSLHFNSTSGARNPRVPARFAFECGLCIQQNSGAPRPGRL